MRASAGQIAAIHNPILLADWTILKGRVTEPISTNRDQSMMLASVVVRQCNLSDFT
jgi:hypothetical protein